MTPEEEYALVKKVADLEKAVSIHIVKILAHDVKLGLLDGLIFALSRELALRGGDPLKELDKWLYKTRAKLHAEILVKFSDCGGMSKELMSLIDDRTDFEIGESIDESDGR